MKVTLATAAALTGLSDRTLRRWIADGLVERGDGARTTIALDALARFVLLDIDDDSRAVIAAADTGDADAQNSLALLFLAARLPERAAYWLEHAAAQGHADAMHWLARAHLGADGEQALGVMWLARSAAQGHLISAQQLASIVSVPHARA
jgi:TPR repeat protein